MFADDIAIYEEIESQSDHKLQANLNVFLIGLVSGNLTWTLQSVRQCVYLINIYLLQQTIESTTILYRPNLL